MKKPEKRDLILKLGIALSFVLLLIFFVKIQLFDREKYEGGSVSESSVTVEAARGEILDRNGLPLVTNRQGNSLVFTYSLFPKKQEERNRIILSLIHLFEEAGAEYIGELPIKAEPGGFSFIPDKEEDIAFLKSPEMLDLNAYATAQNCFDALVKKYSLEGLSVQDALKTAAVCVNMSRVGFSGSLQYIFAEDIATELASVIMENRNLYKGAEILIVPYREYNDGSIAPHILGRVSVIQKDAYEREKEALELRLKRAKKEHLSEAERDEIIRNAYRMNDDYGNSGIEGKAESYLRGKRGVKRISVATDGSVSEEYTVKPKQGNTVLLTLDRGLQKAAQEALARNIDSMTGPTELPYRAGAVIVQNVNTGEILACAVYPSYDNSTWKENYSKWAGDHLNNPLWNRALMSTYEPGSTFKPCVAVAGLEEGVISPSFIWNCKASYTYFSDHTFWCVNHKAHGPEDVVHALKDSCNCFFYETGRLLGIDRIDSWAAAFGLGSKTGIELNEAEGILASKEYRETSGGVWHPGDTVQAAIGQSDHQFTLIQLSNYVSTIANGGTRLRPHFIKAVKSYDYKETVLEKEPKVEERLKISPNNLRLVQKGMLLVATEGYAAGAFEGLPVQVAAKTGTSEVVKKINGSLREGTNSFLISYAPFDLPEIAISVGVENATVSTVGARIAGDIYKYYFTEKTLSGTQPYNTVLA